MQIIGFLLKVNPNDRPNCDEILKHPLVKKRLEFFQAQAGENESMMDNKKLHTLWSDDIDVFI